MPLDADPVDPVDPGVLAWVATQVPGGAHVAARSLSQSGRGGPWMLEVSGEGPVSCLVLQSADPASEAARSGFATEAAAMEVAHAHDLPAPRLVAVDLTGEACGRLAILCTALPGSTRIPGLGTRDRLRAMGRAAAGIHAVDLEVTTSLPLRSGPLEGAGFGGGMPGRTGELFASAHHVLETASAPGGRIGFAHGDLWQGNMLWEDGRHTGTVDWDFAGVGPAGIDLGSLRCDAAVMFGVDAADQVLAGWEEAWGGPADAVAHWDVIAAASSPQDMAGWVPNFHAQGRTDLDVPTTTRRRDELLARALAELT